MGFILIVIWASGLFIELHPDAYGDIFLNFTPIYLVVAAGFLIKEKYKKYWYLAIYCVYFIGARSGEPYYIIDGHSE